ncbi:MAG: sulfatase [Leptospiraceae bacterium]|nr:sulfatase [Leptospiraceae bacterium]
MSQHEKTSSNFQVYDLSRILKNAKVQNFQFNSFQELNHYWKKNPNRYSDLSISQKWLSQQITFQEDSNVFRNTSKEAIFFTPNMELEWEFPSGEYVFYFSLAKMNTLSQEGYFEIQTNNQSLQKISLSEIPNETWKNFRVKIPIHNRLKLRWVTKEGYLYIGSPILIFNSVQKPNVILFVIDAMRRDALGCANSNYSVTPNLDELCKNALLFTNHYANANWTKPSMISMFFGEYASNLGIVNTGFQVYDYEKEIFYRKSKNGLVNSLRKNGYFTQSIMNNVFLLEYTGVGVDLGFHSIEQIGKDFHDTEEITKASLNFLKTHPKEIPFFLHINYNTPHGPYEPPPNVLEKVNLILKDKHLSNIQKRYLAEIFYTDMQIGKILQELKNSNKLQNTWILVTSDHGEMFSEHHTFEKNEITGTLYGHGQTLYEEELAIPFFIYVPKEFENKVQTWTYKNPSSNVSILPTILGLLGFQNENETKGVDYSKFFFKKEPFETSQTLEAIIYAEGRMMESLLEYPYKYIRYFPGYTNTQLQGRIPPTSKWEEVYNLQHDILEKENLITNTELLSKMRKKLKENLLLKNAFHLIFPEDKYAGTFFARGEIYWIETDGNMKYNFLNRYLLQFEKEKGQPEELTLYTTYPVFDFQLDFLNQVTKYKIGKWQIPNGEGRETTFEFLVSPHPVQPIDKTQVLLYNDGKMSKNTYKTGQVNISGEVKNILKSWGYIHE